MSSGEQTERRIPRVTGRGILVGALCVLTALVGAAVTVVPHLIRAEQGQLDRVMPTEPAGDAVDPLQAGVEAFFDEKGVYPTSVDEMTTAGVFERDPDFMYRVFANADGSAFVAATAGFTGTYAAFTSESDEIGEGDSFREALEASGWTPEWADEEGFAPLPVVHKSWGGMEVSGTEVRAVSYDFDRGEYTATVTPLPVAGTGASWEEAVRETGADPAVFPAAPTGRAEASSDAGRVTVAPAGDGWSARFDAAPTRHATGSDLDTVLDETGLSGLAAVADGVFTCATATSLTTAAEATGCTDGLGGAYAWGTTGVAAASAQMLPEAFGLAGVGATWAADNDLIVPTYEDLF